LKSSKWLPVSFQKSCASLKNVLAYTKRDIVLCCLQKSLANSTGFGVKPFRTYQLNVLINNKKIKSNE
jgi:hypothetical protein